MSNGRKFLFQIDGNILGPKIIGESIGLGSFWILFSILVFGSLFGIAGMICAVPIFAVVYKTVKNWSADRLGRKGLPQNTESYQRGKSISASVEKERGGRPEMPANENTTVKNE